MQEVLDLSAITSTETSGNCPPFEVSILNSDGSSLDADIFAYSSETLTIESDELSSIDMHELKITAKYEGAQYTKVAELSFTVDIDDPCLDAELTIGQDIISSLQLEYTL